MGSSLAKYTDTCSKEVNDNNSMSQDKFGPFPVVFADLFKEKTPSPTDGSYQIFNPLNYDILEVDETYIDKVEDLWGHYVLGGFAGRFLGLKAIRNLVDT